MRSLIDEHGHIFITLIIAAVAIASILLGTAIPQMKSYTENMVSNDVVAPSDDYVAIADSAARQSPRIISSSISVVYPASIVFDDYISDGSIRAINADGVDISDKIRFEPADEALSALYDENTNIFTPTTAGEYTFNLSVIDITNREYFGKISRETVIITVQPPEIESEGEDGTENGTEAESEVESEAESEAEI